LAAAKPRARRQVEPRSYGPELAAGLSGQKETLRPI
jgi:hypothetical protein